MSTPFVRVNDPYASVTVTRSKIAIFGVGNWSTESKFEVKSQVTILVERYLSNGYEAATVYDVNPNSKNGACFVVCGLPESVLDGLCAGLTQYFAHYGFRSWRAEKANDQRIRRQDKFTERQACSPLNPKTSGVASRNPEMYKTNFCVEMRDTGFCDYGEHCAFIHPEDNFTVYVPNPPNVLSRHEVQGSATEASTLGQQHSSAYDAAATPSTAFLHHQEQRQLAPAVCPRCYYHQGRYCCCCGHYYGHNCCHGVQNM